MYYRKSRERIPFFSYVFLSQDRREDRPDTLIFQVTEDILRFGIYFPFKILVANPIGAPAIIFIPVAVNNIGDGLAEPVGVRFGKHKYSTTALYHKGKFFKSKFTRSYEGSSCVFITTAIVVAFYYNTFTSTQFWITISFLPFLMTLAEAKAPHTNDGPFLALVGCSFLSLVLLL
jgi:phytol kinase